MGYDPSTEDSFSPAVRPYSFYNNHLLLTTSLMCGQSDYPHTNEVTPMTDAPDMLDRLAAWAASRPAVRAVILTSTRALPRAPDEAKRSSLVDLLSDYDTILFVDDVHPFFTDRSWVDDFGTVLVAYWDPLEPAPGSDLEHVGNVVQYRDGLKIDFTVCPVALLHEWLAAGTLPDELDAGYRVLVDKDGQAARLPAPTYTAYLPAPPDEETYRTLINDFFSDPPYVAKCLWRDELLPARWCLEQDMKHTYLRPMLEWRAELDHHWTARIGSLGKGLKKVLPAGLWRELEATYAGAGMAENWESLRRTVALFGRVAREVGGALGYAYPDELEREVMAYVERIRRLKPGATSWE